MKVVICEEEAHFNNPNTERVSVEKTGRLSICVSEGTIRFERFVKQGSPVLELAELLAEGVRYVEAMIKNMTEVGER